MIIKYWVSTFICIPCFYQLTVRYTSGTHSVGGHPRRAVMLHDGRKFSALWYSYRTSITYMIHHWPEVFVKYDCIPIPNILHIDQSFIVMYFESGPHCDLELLGPCGLPSQFQSSWDYKHVSPFLCILICAPIYIDTSVLILWFQNKSI